VGVIISQEYNVIVNSEELIDTTEYQSLEAMFRINRCRYNRVSTLVCKEILFCMETFRVVVTPSCLSRNTILYGNI